MTDSYPQPPRFFARFLARFLAAALRAVPALAALLVLMGALGAPAATAQPNSRPSGLLEFSAANEQFDTDGYMVGGDYWNTVKPLNSADPDLGQLGGVRTSMLLGSTRGLRNPNGLWPSGYRYTQTFRNAHSITLSAFDADGWAGYGPGNPVYEADGTDDTGGAGGTSRFLFAGYSDTVAGADDPARNYTRPARFTDASRTHLVYESGYPTLAGVDVRLRAHQFSPNEQNLNDFVVLEITLDNTGAVDTDADGTVDETGNVVDGIALHVGTSPTPSIRIGDGGGRGGNGFEGLGRIFGYVAQPDGEGSPYNLFTYWAGVQTEGQSNVPEGARTFGVNFFGAREGYTDIWNGWEFLGVKQGGVPATDTRRASAYPSMLSKGAPDKETVFGTHPVGEGPRKGWYTSSQWRSALDPGNASDLAFFNATATWYEDYGKTTSSREGADLAPNSAFFSGGTPGDITTFEVGSPGARPNGDYKYASEDLPVGIHQPIFEEAWNPQAGSGDLYGGAGYTRNYNFTESVGQGVGPFRLEVGEEITIVLVAAAGFRFEGLEGATAAAEWAWENGWDIRGQGNLRVPPAPDVNVLSTPNQSALVQWTDVAGVAGGEVDGYKVWRASQFLRTDYREEGMRRMDRYHQQHAVDEDPAQFLDPVNPLFSPGADFFSGDAQGIYQPAEWGDYDLVARIPAGELGNFATDGGPFDYAFEDEEAVTGFTYWYYVSAYNEGNFTGPAGPVAVGHVESSNLNRNGRNAPDASDGEIGLDAPWGGTYPFAINSPEFPGAGSTQLQNLGAAFTLVPPTAPVERVAEQVTVTPNPYKITALNDVRSDPSSHAVNFLNMPETFTLTIIDVAGQIIFQDRVEGASDGRYRWNLFSKDGVEIASGFYIYHIQYGDGREVTGHLAILR
jgi:hypothetical protein